MYTFTEDWHSTNIGMWERVLGSLKGRPGLRALEIGSYQGRSAIWLLENVLTEANSGITCVDTFEGSDEHSDSQKRGLEDIFDGNTRAFGEKVTKAKGASKDVLRSMPARETYDIVYIDGAHDAESVMTDAVLCFHLIKSGGIVIFDDYGFPGVCKAADSFLQIFSGAFDVVDRGWQLALRKR